MQSSTTANPYQDLVAYNNVTEFLEDLKILLDKAKQQDDADDVIDNLKKLIEIASNRSDKSITEFIDENSSSINSVFKANLHFVRDTINDYFVDREHPSIEGLQLGSITRPRDWLVVASKLARTKNINFLNFLIPDFKVFATPDFKDIYEKIISPVLLPSYILLDDGITLLPVSTIVASQQNYKYGNQFLTPSEASRLWSCDKNRRRIFFPKSTSYTVTQYHYDVERYRIFLLQMLVEFIHCFTSNTANFHIWDLEISIPDKLLNLFNILREIYWSPKSLSTYEIFFNFMRAYEQIPQGLFSEFNDKIKHMVSENTNNQPQINLRYQSACFEPALILKVLLVPKFENNSAIVEARKQIFITLISSATAPQRYVRANILLRRLLSKLDSQNKKNILELLGATQPVTLLEACTLFLNQYPLPKRNSNPTLYAAPSSFDSVKALRDYILRILSHTNSSIILGTGTRTIIINSELTDIIKAAGAAHFRHTSYLGHDNDPSGLGLGAGSL
jgi:hypothetical protein